MTGTASYYSSRYDGRITAGRERFSSNALTAASRDLPFGTRVKVTNLANHRSVVVRINDRGPFVASRSISVTRRAARQLGFVKAGTAQVSIEPISNEKRN
jgi:rare lipoprotein A